MTTARSLRLLALGLALGLGFTLAACAPPDDLDAGSDGLGERIEPFFDLATVVGCGGTYACPWDGPPEANCACQADFDRHNYARTSGGLRRGHLLAVSSDLRDDEIRGMGNRSAYYVDRMNEGWTSGARARAAAMMADASAAFPGGAPRWFLLNEISAGLWQNGGDTGTRYRRFVAQLAEELSVRHGRKVVIFVPFARPGAHGPDWQAVARHAYLGVESYVTGASIGAHGYSQTWVRAQYQATLDAYANRGVSSRRLVMTEHFGHTVAGVNRGRSGVGIGEWRRAVEVRTRAARTLPVFGHASYAWGFNQMGANNTNRWSIQDLYHRLIGGGTIELPADSSTEPAPSEAAMPALSCEPPTLEIDGRCVPSCASAGGDVCEPAGSTACDGAEGLESWDCEVCCARSAAPTPPPAPAPEPAPTCESVGRASVSLTTVALGDGRAAHCYSRDGSCEFACGKSTQRFENAFSVLTEPVEGSQALYRCERASSSASEGCARFWLTRDPGCEGFGEGSQVELLGWTLPPDASTCGAVPLRRLYRGGLFDNHIFTLDPAYNPTGYAEEGHAADAWY